MVESNVRNRRFKAVNHQHDFFHVSIWQLSIIYTYIDIEFFAISEYNKFKEFYFNFIEMCVPIDTMFILRKRITFLRTKFISWERNFVGTIFNTVGKNVYKFMKISHVQRFYRSHRKKRISATFIRGGVSVLTQRTKQMKAKHCNLLAFLF